MYSDDIQYTSPILEDEDVLDDSDKEVGDFNPDSLDGEDEKDEDEEEGEEEEEGGGESF